MAWYCISFGLIARYHTVMYRCYSAPANYRVVHLVIFGANCKPGAADMFTFELVAIAMFISRMDGWMGREQGQAPWAVCW